MPSRVQRKRSPGWRTPECSCGCGQPARYVGRPTRWGNPFVVGGLTHFLRLGAWTPARIPDSEAAVRFYRNWINLDTRYNTGTAPPTARELSTLRGHDLSCFCPLDQACHASVLLELSNA